MAITAVPRYLGSDFSAASPGLRFGMYLPLWGVDSRSGALLWTTHDVNERRSGQQQQLRESKDENKEAALRQSAPLTADDMRRLKALVDRQRALAAPGVEAGSTLAIDAKALAPFTTGLGNEHPLENGFAFLDPYGLPYLPGSGVKGVVRAAARELAAGIWGETRGWTDDHITALFGLQSEDGGTTHQRGTLRFWDVIPQIAGDRLLVEVMTPHQSHYLQGRESPHDSGQPNPIMFLTVPPGSAFAFHVECDLPRLHRLAPALATDAKWKELLDVAFAHAFEWLGFGAKTAVGYGAMALDRQAASKRAAEVESARQQRAEQAKQAARAAEIEAMDPVQRELEQLFDRRSDRNQSKRSVYFNALKRGEFSGEVKRAAAERVRQSMQAEKCWKEQSTKKNPDKDHDYQATLLVKKWLSEG